MRGHIGRGDFIIGSDLQIQNGFLRRLSAKLSGDVRNAQIGDEKDEKATAIAKGTIRDGFILGLTPYEMI